MGDGIERDRAGEPRCRSDTRKVHLAHADGDDISHDHTRDDGHELHQSLAEGEHEDGSDEGGEGENPVGLRHIHGTAGEGETDEDDGWSDDHWREDAVEQFLALPFHEGTHHEIHQ